MPPKVTRAVRAVPPTPNPKRRASRQVIRLLTIMRLLAEERQPKPHELAKSMGVSLRTILRDLDTLEQIGVPLSGDASGRRMVVKLAPGGKETMGTPPFTQDEAVALLWAALPCSHNVPFLSTLHNASRKLRSFAQQADSDAGVTNLSRVVVAAAGPLPSHATFNPVLQQLITCSLAGTGCRLALAGSIEAGTVEPLFLIYSAQEPFLVGRKDGSLFSIPTACITEVIETKTKFVPPTREWILKISQSWFSTSPGPRMKVVVRFSANVRLEVERYQIHPTQETVALADGGLEVRFTANCGPEAVQWMLGWGDSIEIVAPARLRNVVRQRLRAALKIY